MFYITRRDDPAQLDPFVVCDDCDENICSVEEGDSLDVLVSVAAGHKCPAKED